MIDSVLPLYGATHFYIQSGKTEPTPEQVRELQERLRAEGQTELAQMLEGKQ